MKNYLNLEINSKKRYEKFIKEVSKTETVWGLKLKNKDGWAVVLSNEYEDAEVMLFWSEKRLAKLCIVEEWMEYEVNSITLENFMNNWLIGLDEDDLLVGLNWDFNLIGLEVEPIDLLNDLEKYNK